MAMTEEERRKARNEASKRWYAAHKAAKAAKNKLLKARPVEFKKANPKPAQDSEKLERALDRFVEKGTKAADAYRDLVKSAAETLGEVFKSGDEKLIAKACRLVGKKLSLEVKPMPEDGKAEIAVSIGAKLFRIPKAKPAPVAKEPEPDESPKETEETELAKHKVVAVNPSLLTGIEEGSVTTADVDASQEDSQDDPDCDDEECDGECDEDEEEEKDPEEMDDDEYARHLERQAERQAEEWATGHADVMHEMEKQGAYDNYEN